MGGPLRGRRAGPSARHGAARTSSTRAKARGRNACWSPRARRRLKLDARASASDRRRRGSRSSALILLERPSVSDGVLVRSHDPIRRQLEVVHLAPRRSRSRRRSPPAAFHVLNPSQAAAAAEARQRHRARMDFPVSLLDGVTGSGKTEVYLEAAVARDAGRRAIDAQVLILLPEIALTPAILDRVASAGSAFAPDAWHSGMTPTRRREVWERVANGKARIVVGARSALFLPFCKALRLVVVDEEHDGSYKQEDGFIYQGARPGGGPGQDRRPVPSSSSQRRPSLETSLERSRNGRFRLAAAGRPPWRGRTAVDRALIDMRRESSGASGRIGFRGPLVAAVRTDISPAASSRCCSSIAGATRPWCCAKRLRRAHALAGQRLMAGGAPLQRAAGLSSHGVFHAQAGPLPILRRQGER